MNLSEKENTNKFSYVNIQTQNLRENTKATILLENPTGHNLVLTRTELVKKVRINVYIYNFSNGLFNIKSGFANTNFYVK